MARDDGLNFGGVGSKLPEEKSGSYLRQFEFGRILSQESKDNLLSSFSRCYNGFRRVVGCPFVLAFNFIETRIGILFTLTALLLGFAAFIILTTFGMPLTAAIVLAGSIFGTLAVASIGGTLQKHCFFCATDDSKCESLSIKEPPEPDAYHNLNM
ncbi:MAG: hypothetical protein P1U74_05215 [Legionellaceae bacterium]|nr:hypothetical protein [Legionellaceae bacterium]